jgi:capsular exopolysaccharide synthesis family protein
VTEDGEIQLFEPAPAVLGHRNPELPKPYEVPHLEEAWDLRVYWGILKKRRWTILSIILCIFTLALIGTLKQKPIYRASALLEIEKENPNVSTLKELFQLEDVSDSYLETQYKLLRSESLARRVVSELHLDQNSEFNAPIRSRLTGKENSSAGAVNAFPTDSDHELAVLRHFEDRVNVEPVRRSRLVQASFDSQDAKLAANIVNSLATNFIQENLENRWEATQKASAWLSQELDGLKIRLEKSEDDLRQYAEANGLLFLETEQGKTENIVDQRLRQLQDELTKAQADRFQKEAVYRLVEAGDYSSLPGVVDNKLMQDLTVRLADLERQEAELTSTFNESYPKVEKIHSQVSRIQQLLDRERKRAAKGIEDDYVAAMRRETLVHKAFEEQQKQANHVAERSVQYNILKREVDTNKQLYEGLLQRLREAGVSAGLKSSNIRIVDPAKPPTTPVKPRILLNLAVGLILGVCCAAGAAFVQEQLDNTLKTLEDIEQFLRVPALALIPFQESLNHRTNGDHALPGYGSLLLSRNRKLLARVRQIEKSGIRIDENGTQHSALSEAFRGLRTSVLLSRAKRPPRSLIFCSAEPGEGKTTVASNLAISLAQLGKRVLLIDGDMRCPRVHKVFNIQSRSGLVTYLAGLGEWKKLVQPVGESGLDCLVSGPVPPNPAELLSSDAMKSLIREVTAVYDFVLIDSPPMLNVADGRILAAMVEGTILVTKEGATPRELVQRAQSHVRDAGGHLIGVVLNGVHLSLDGYYYGYGKYGRVEDAAAAD